MPSANTDDEVREGLLGLDDARIEDVLAPRELESLRMGMRERVTDTDAEHIRRLPETLPSLFADAAVRARDAGFDGVELHYAHAYTMASFLSRNNDRTDGYGGPRRWLRSCLRSSRHPDRRPRKQNMRRSPLPATADLRCCVRH